MYIHNEIKDSDRQNNELYNYNYCVEMGYKNWQDRELLLHTNNNDSNPFNLVWLQNVNRLLALFRYNSASYKLIDIDCDSVVSTLYFAENYTFKYYFGFNFSVGLLDAAKQNQKIFKQEGYDVDVYFLLLMLKILYCLSPPCFYLIALGGIH